MQQQMQELLKNVSNINSQHERDQYDIQKLQEEVYTLKRNNSELKQLYEKFATTECVNIDREQ